MWKPFRATVLCAYQLMGFRSNDMEWRREGVWHQNGKSLSAKRRQILLNLKIILFKIWFLSFFILTLLFLFNSLNFYVFSLRGYRDFGKYPYSEEHCLGTTCLDCCRNNVYSELQKKNILYILIGKLSWRKTKIVFK